ncbi:MAG: 30S ribosomal protein S6 [Acidobacteriota bacterium]
MRRFETIYIADPGLGDEAVAGLMTLFTGVVTAAKGEVLKSEDWGKKKLAYPVQKHLEGHYLLLEFKCDDPGLPHELERRMRMNEKIIKFLTIRIDNDKKRLSWEKKQSEKEKVRAARRAAEEARRSAREAAAAGTVGGADEVPPADAPAVPEEPVS